jgi:hypothetical protein
VAQHRKYIRFDLSAFSLAGSGWLQNPCSNTSLNNHSFLLPMSLGLTVRKRTELLVQFSIQPAPSACHPAGAGVHWSSLQVQQVPICSLPGSFRCSTLVILLCSIERAPWLAASDGCSDGCLLPFLTSTGGLQGQKPG